MLKVVLASHNTSKLPEFAGNTWAPLQYVLGLRQLGIETVWIDQLDGVGTLEDARDTVDPTAPHSLDYLITRFQRTAHDLELDGAWCVMYDGGERYFGMAEEDVRRIARDAVLLLNFSGYLPPASPLLCVPRRAYIDVDPGFTQIWAHQADIGIERHNLFFTVGQNVGCEGFRIPTCGVAWQPIFPPVFLEAWPNTAHYAAQRFSTIADWRGSQTAIFEGEYYSGKREEFIRFLDVPLQAGIRIELALTIGQHDYEDLGLLLGHNWRVRDPYLYAGDLQSYREFIQQSRAEFSVAKSGYVKSGSGWISDRTALYLASGRPVLVQSTGFEGRLPVGQGLLTFRTPEEAVAGIHAINGDYAAHSRAARTIAETYFASGPVLESLLERAAV